MNTSHGDNGYTAIDNALFDAIVRSDFTKRQYKIVLVAIRKTYGWRKISDDITSIQMSMLTGLADSHCRSAIRELVDMNVLRVQPGKYGQTISIVSNYKLWNVGVKHDIQCNIDTNRENPFPSRIQQPIELHLIPKDDLMAIANTIRPDLLDPKIVFDKFEAHNHGCKYLQQEWESKWRIWLLREREVRSIKNTNKILGGFLTNSSMSGIMDRNEVIKNG
jgi:phage replication O-like protein O